MGGFDFVGSNEQLKNNALLNIQIPKNGYLYIYTANQTPNIPVFFDNLQVVHQRGQLLEEKHYYPMGLLMEGISSRAAGALPTRQGYQGKELQTAEFLDGTGLDEYDFVARYYDPQLGRWHNPDPANQFTSPYAAMGNNWISGTDPDGRFAFLPIIIGAVMGAMQNGMQAEMNGGSFWDGAWKGALTGAVGGALGNFAPIGLLPGAAYGAASGALVGGLSAALNGGNIGQGMLSGGIWGGALGGIFGGIEAIEKGGNFWTGARPNHEYLASQAPQFPSGSGPAPANNDYLKQLYKKNYSDIKGVTWMSMDEIPRDYNFGADGYLINPKGQQVLAVTVPRVWAHGNTSYISFSRAAFASKQLLATTMAHELGHVIFNFQGLAGLAKESMGYRGTKFINNEGHLAIYTMEQRLSALNGWSFSTKIANTITRFSEDHTLLNPILTLVRKIKFP